MSSDGAAADVSGAAAEQPHRLDKKWTFWFDNVSKPKQGAAWGNNLRDAYTFDTVEEFWCSLLYKWIGLDYVISITSHAEYATKYKTLIYLVGSASAEVIADMALCPMEAVKVRVQTQPGFARGLGDGLPKFVRSDGVLGDIMDIGILAAAAHAAANNNLFTTYYNPRRNLVYAVNQDAEDAFKKTVELDRLIDMLKNASDREIHSQEPSFPNVSLILLCTTDVEMVY
ncbi:hypothetical protein SSX86_007847 [Deinandra increscens subsp. villosa]|uniref:mRNA cap-binding protein n=1 Tax=Deinandra increscens subsp. villosa TaxID=3103831 RepID=A0AAP0DM35_9ASTR